MPLAALREILAAARLEAPEMPKIGGADPVLPTRYRVGTAGAASLAALGVGVSRLGELRGLPPQKVAVDLRAAAGANPLPDQGASRAQRVSDPGLSPRAAVALFDVHAAILLGLSLPLRVLRHSQPLRPAAALQNA